MLFIEGGSIFTKAWSGIKSAGEAVANATVAAYEWCKEHVTIELGKVS